MNFILFDNSYRTHLLPLTFTRPQADIRIGILTIREKWEHVLGCKLSTITQSYLSQKFPLHIESVNIIIAGNICPNTPLIEAILNLKIGEALFQNDEILACCILDSDLKKYSSENFNITTYSFKKKQFSPTLNIIKYVYDVFILNDEELRKDYQLLTRDRVSISVNNTNQIYGHELFVEEGAIINGATLNTQTGPIYIDKNAEIMEGAMIRGPFSLGEYATVKMGAKIYGATTVGPHCKVGGELSNVVFFAYSNKGHDGFLGNSVIGEWCNFGADTNCSNLKNNYSNIKLWNYQHHTFMNTNLQFCGLIMGDHSKCSINTMFNTGTIVGVSANIYGSEFHRNFIPSFYWGSRSVSKEYDFESACKTAELMMQRRNLHFTDEDRKIFQTIFENTKQNRNY